MEITPQTREISVEDWWAANHDGDQLVDGISEEELLELAESLGLTLSQMGEMNFLGANFRARAEATKQIPPASYTLGLHSATHASSPTLGKETYGSNEEVYNPYNPLTSKEYLAQEVAAGRKDPAGMPQRSLRASRKTQEPATESLRQLLNGENNFPGSLTDDVSNWSEYRPTLPLIAPDSDASTEGSSGSRTNDVSPYLLEEYSDSSRLLGRRIDSDDLEAGADSDSEDQSRPDFAASASISVLEEHKLSSDSMGTPAVDSFGSRQVRAAGPATRAKELLLDITSQNNESPTEIANTSTHQPATGVPGLTGLVDGDRKRRRTDRSPLEPVPPPPVPGVIGAAGTATRRAITATFEWPGRSRLRAEAPVFVPRSTRTILSPPPRAQPVDFGQVIPENIRVAIDRHRSQHPRQTSTAILLPAHIPMRHLIFTSELIPASLGKRKRRNVLSILRTKAPYVPACVAMPPTRPKIQYHISLKPKRNVESCSSDRNDAPLGSQDQGWPVAPYGLPLEVFHHIARYLPRSSLESMRLVSREFERNISNVQFRKVVVPFRPEIYDILDPWGSFVELVDVRGKGKEKGRAKWTCQRELLALIRTSRSIT